jgi:glucose-1-phosphate thymidylyltransferase
MYLSSPPLRGGWVGLFMKAIIPVAGIGTRLQPLTNKVPKVLLNVAGKTMLFHLIDELIASGRIDKIILIIGYLGSQIKDAVNNAYGQNPKISFEFVEQKGMLGLGHAIYHAKDFVSNEPVLVVLGDTIFEFDLEKMLSSEHSALGVKEVEDIRRWGIVESEKGFITRMIEKPSGPEITKSKSAIAGIYLIKDGQKLFDAVRHLMANDIKTKDEYQVTDAMQKMIDDGEKFVPFEINWFDCGKPETLLSANAYLLERDHSSVKQEIAIDTIIIPPVFIGNNCIIQNSTIGPYTTLADGSSVINSTVKNSIIYEHAKVEDAELDEVILGHGENIKGVHNKIIQADGTELGF